MYDRLLDAKKKTRLRFCTRRDSPGGLLNSWLDIQLSNSVYSQKTVYLCLSKYSPTGSRCTTRSIAKKSPTGSLPPAVPLAITRTFRPWTHCWTYSHHCQIADKNPSKRWNGEFRGFRVCIGWISTTRFLLLVFMCSINFSLFFWVSFPATTPRATTPHRSLFRLPRRGLPRPYRCIQANRLPRLQGYHTRATTLQTNFCVQAGYHTCG